MKRIRFQTAPHPDKKTLNTFNPLVKAWFTDRFKTFAPPQKFSIVNIHQRENTLVSSPTGSGKTLSAFLAILNELIGLSQKQLLEERVYCIYVSPLKALANDIERNLNTPLKEMKKRAKAQNQDFDVRVGIRSGDTPASEKAKMLKKPPHILITTPESLAIMLSTIKFREHLKKVEWVIVDEIHSLADNKRGAHLSLSLERLHTLTSFTRIGLSATVSPLEEVAKYLVGYEDPDKKIFRRCNIVDVQYLKKLDLKVLSPVKDLISTPHEESRKKLYALLDQLIQQHKTTLIFTNTRSATERVVHHLKDAFPKNYVKLQDTVEDDASEESEEDDQKQAKQEKKGAKKKKAGQEDEEEDTSFIGAHHGSLSREHRLMIEKRLKAGKLKCVVSSTSLELGIDIGYIDLVILLGSPKSVARALQRIGRSGHQLHQTAKGRIIVLDRDDLVECSVLLKSAVEKKIDNISVPKNPADVLAQQIFGMALEEPKNLDDLFQTIRKSYTYATLDRQTYEAVLRYLSGEYASLEDRNVYAKIWVDEENRMLGKRGKLARVIYMTNIGTIPDESGVRVKVGNKVIGIIDENFLERLRKGDIFVLGGNVYQFMYSQGMTAFVKASVNRPPTVPSWVSEQLPLSFDLAMDIQRFRRYMEDLFESNASKKDIMAFLHDYLYVDGYAANSIYTYFREQFLYKEIPHDKKLVIEHYKENNTRHIVFHACFGRRTNDVLSRAIGFAMGKVIKKDVEININDNGFAIMTKENVNASRMVRLIKSAELRKIMEIALEKTEVLSRRFRHSAGRGLMILRNYAGRKKTVSRQARSSRLLLSAARKIGQDFPILREAKREVLEDLMDIQHATQVIEWIEEGKLELKEVATDIPSPFALNLITMGYTDIMKMEDKIAFLKRMHDMVLAKIALDEGKKNA